MPYHIISNHYIDVSITSMSGHYLSCYGKNSDTSFLVCLTCHGGTFADSSTKQGLEWITKHSKNIECKKSHSQLYQELKKNLSETSSSPVPTVVIQTPPTPTPTISTTIDTLWDQFKSDKRMNQYMVKLEEQCDPVSYGDSDDESNVEYSFTAMDGFKMAIITGMENKKDIGKMKDQINDLEKEIEAIKIEQYNQNLKYQQMIFDLQTSLKREQRNNEDTKRALSISDSELLRYKRFYPSPPEE